MFTGIVESTGTIVSIERRGEAWRLRIRAAKACEGAAAGDSIAVDGVCLTATAVDADGFAADVSAETRARSTIALYEPGTAVNLERALRLGGRLGGHLVQGHVDARGTIASLERTGATVELSVRFPPEGRRYLAEKGAVAVDGVSLTVAALTRDTFTVAVIPYTLAHTTLLAKRAGDEVNLEYDVIAKYVESQLEWKKADANAISIGFLKERGF